jgi:cytochrome c-type biogenesis protein CcmH/NrfF
VGDQDVKRLVAMLCLIMVSGSIEAQVQPKSIDEPSLNQDVFKDVAADLRCPTCTGISVLDSDAPFSVQIKNEVKQQLTAGKSKSQILEFFTDRYGPWILREPPKEGFHLWAWIVPMFFLFFGPLGVWYFFWRRGSSFDSKNEAAEFVPVTVEDVVTQMRMELDRMRESRKGGQGE